MLDVISDAEKLTATLGENDMLAYTTILAAYAVLGAAVGMALTAATRWATEDLSGYYALIDPRLDPGPRTTSQPTRSAAARVLLQAFVSDMRSQLSARELAARCPLQVVRADLAAWMGQTIPLEEPVEGWLVRYDGGPAATAVSQDGLSLQLDATRPAGGARDCAKTTLAVIETPDGTHHLVHAPAKTLERTSYYVVRGFGRWRRPQPAAAGTPGARSLTHYYTALDA